ncbi:MAG TPA: hypothetical protein VFF53_13550 [Geobacteraceae bacterium]|nr:hypothetical protein [Geobacteraceae bacterium]
MGKMRYGIVVLGILLCCSASPASAQVSIGIGLPHVSIGINLPVFPELVPVPGYPVYYAPRVNANYFFYDGMYWVFLDDYWYTSYWYNGPWRVVEPEVLPLFILRIPVRYYRHPPQYFRGWRADAPPRWGQHWGHDWEQHRKGWDTWKRGSTPARAPLPVYQRKYTGDRYPRQVEQQQTLHRQQYRYQPRDKTVRQHFQPQREQRAPAPVQRGRQEEPRMRAPGQQDVPRPERLQQGSPAGPRPQQPYQTPPQQRGPAPREQKEQPGAVQHERQAPRPHGQEQRLQERERVQEPRGRGQEQRQEQRQEEERGRERNR